MLMKIKNQYHVLFTASTIKMTRQRVAWLQQHGNPYVMTGRDTHGDTAIDLGVYGTPKHL